MILAEFEQQVFNVATVSTICDIPTIPSLPQTSMTLCQPRFPLPSSWPRLSGSRICEFVRFGQTCLFLHLMVGGTHRGASAIIDVSSGVTNGQDTHAETSPSFDLDKDWVLYLVPYTHLDTQWRWDYKRTIDVYLRDTLEKNFALFEKFPHTRAGIRQNP